MARGPWPQPPCCESSPGRSRGQVMQEDGQPGAPQAWLTLAAAGQWQQASPLHLRAASAVGVQPQAQGPASGQGFRGGGLLEASEASLESGSGMRVWCGCKVRPQPSPLSCGQQSRRGEETQLGLAWREEDRRQGGSQRHREDREAGGTTHLQSDGREAASPGQRPHRGLGLLLRPSTPSTPLPPGAGWALH